MPRVNEHEDLQKHTLNFYAGDIEKLARLYPEVGASVVVRRLIRKHLQDMANKLSPLPTINSEEI